MNKVLRVDEKLRRFNKPSMVPTEIPKMKSGDIVIMCAGFEDRSIELLERISKENVAKQIFLIVFKYLPYVKENKLEEIKKLCNTTGLKFEVLKYDRQNPIIDYKRINNLVDLYNGRIYLDISGMSKILIVQIIVNLFKNLRQFIKTSIIYSEAKQYPPSEDEVEKLLKENYHEYASSTFFISSGVFEVAIIPELSSLTMHGQPIRLIFFPSFNTQQLITLRNEIQPHFFTLINGIPHLNKYKWRLESIRQLNRLNEIRSIEEKKTSTLFYKETLDYLLYVYDKYNTLQKIVVAPTGSKMQTVAVGIFRSFLSDIHIIYPTPVKFIDPENYTSGVIRLYQLELDCFNQLM